MYQITRKSRIKETLQLCHANGDVAVELEIDLNVDEIAGRVNKAYEALGMAQLALQKDQNSQKAMEAYGDAVIAVLDVIFGEEGTKQIAEFYEGHYSEMLLDLFPFINGEIMPKIRAASADRKAQLMAAAKMAQQGNREQRRHRK